MDVHGFVFSARDVCTRGVTCNTMLGISFDTKRSKSSSLLPREMSNYGPNEQEIAAQKQETVASLADYNDGTWASYAVHSFGVTSDVAAGPTKRHDFSGTPEKPYLYKTHTKTMIDSEGLRMQETFEWDVENSDDGGCSNTAIKLKTVHLGESADVDSVDGSYSIDVPLLDLPRIITSSDSIAKFAIEQSVAISDDERVRCFILYGMDDRLSRVVICNEKKIADFDENINDSSEVDSMVDGILNKMNLAEPRESSVKSDPGDMDDRMQQLQEALARGNESNEDQNVSISRYPISIFGLVGGVWLGDAVNREHSRPLTNKGFGATKTKKRKSASAGPGMKDGFAEWTTGVQKVAMTYQWDYGKSLRQKMSYGNAMGAACNLPVSSAGEIILNEMSKTAKSLDERMIYIDFDVGSYAAFIVGSAFVKVRREVQFLFEVFVENIAFLTQLL